MKEYSLTWTIVVSTGCWSTNCFNISISEQDLSLNSWWMWCLANFNCHIICGMNESFDCLIQTDFMNQDTLSRWMNGNDFEHYLHMCRWWQQEVAATSLEINLLDHYTGAFLLITWGWLWKPLVASMITTNFIATSLHWNSEVTGHFR